MNIKSLLSFVSKLSKRERIIFYVTIGVITVVLLDRIILTPILDKMRLLSDTISSQEEEIKKSLLIITQEKRIEGESELYESYLSEPQTEEKAITAFLKDVENIAKRSSIYLVDIKPSGKEGEAGNIQYFVKLDFEAQMEQVFNFFYNVSNHNQLIKIEDYQIRPKTSGSTIIVCSLSISKTIITE